MEHKIKTLFFSTFLSLTLISGCGGGGTDESSVVKITPAPTQLVIIDQKLGSGEEALLGKIAVVRYSLYLYSDTATDFKGRMYSNNLNDPNFLKYKLGDHEVIPGLEQGTFGMKVGGVRTLIIPPQLAYGNKESSGLPADATIVATLELVAIAAPTTTGP